MPLPTTPPAGPAMLSSNARTVLEKRYLVKDQTGAPTEQPEEMFWRVATTVADADRRYGASDGAVQTVSEDFYRLMTERRFEPNSPTLMNAGRPLGQLERVFRPPGRRCARERQGRDLRHAQVDGDHPSERRRDGLRILAHPAQGVNGAVDDRCGVGPRVVHAALRCIHRCGEAGRYAPRREHGDPPGRSSRTSSSSSPARKTSPRSPTSTSRSRSPTRSWRP